MSDDFNSNLIDAVAANPLLYDILHPDYKNVIKTNDLWRKVASDLGSSVNVCQTRWRTLRSAYVKKHKRAMSDGRRVRNIPSWRFSNQMSFLEDFISHKDDAGSVFAERIVASSKKRNPTVSIKELVSSNDEDDEDSSSALVSATPHSLNSGKRKKLQESPPIDFINLLQENRKQMEETMFERSLDRFDHFGNFIAAHLKTKPSEIAEFYMKEITNLVLSDINIEISMKNQNADSSPKV